MAPVHSKETAATEVLVVFKFVDSFLIEYHSIMTCSKLEVLVDNLKI